MSYKRFRDDIILGLILAALGFIFATRPFILFMNGLNPLENLVVYYTILFVGLLALAKLGLIIHNVKISKPVQSLGLLMITFAIFIVLDWTSCHQSIVINGSCNIPNIYLGSEDGATYWFYSTFVSSNDTVATALTYYFTPFVLGTVGGILAGRKRATV